MFDCGPKAPYITGQQEKFVRLDDLDSRLSSSSSSVPTNKCSFGNHTSHVPSRSFRKGVKKGSEGLKSIGRSLGFGAVFSEDLKVSEKKIFDPQDKIVGALWYLLSVERNDTCWQRACKHSGNCSTDFLYCGNQRTNGYETWSNISDSVLTSACPVDDEDNPPFDFGIFRQALASQVVSSNKFLSKYCYCLCTLGQGLQTSTYPGESIFSIALAIFGLILFALLIGNMQTYLQSLTIRLEEMRVKRRDSEQWMHHRLLPPDLRERVPLFEKMDERLLDAICERLKPWLYTESSYIVREGDPVDEMIFLIRGRLESVTTDGGRSGFFNRSLLKEGDFCGEELLTWALDPKSAANLPSSTRTAAWRRYSKRKLLEVRRKEEADAEAEAGAGGLYSIRATFLASRFAANALRGVHRNRNLKELVKLQKPPEPDFTGLTD
ncbi:cyclic nucleotide gated channel 5 [Striga asiatica]|uniref:Cyclic nucleotide gated channel 5 n=1 Tax=Striga asiatica TaxID=4170 RepID=A0A5A7QDS4_STRAF|nr:cyclic nucleotide gated channel 5 [Striga asiatica]